MPGTRSSSGRRGNSGAASAAAGSETETGRVRYDVIHRPAVPIATPATATEPAVISTARRLGPESVPAPAGRADRVSSHSVATPTIPVTTLGQTDDASTAGIAVRATSS